MESRFRKLFEAGWIGKVKIKNRIVMLPMGGYFPGPNGEFTNKTLAYFKERAKGGVGLIIVGLSWPIPQEEPITRKFTSLCEEKLLPSHYDLTEKVHLYGAKIGIQLGHFGSQLNLGDWGGKPPVSPSGIQQFAVDGTPFAVPRPLSLSEIYRLIEQHVVAARNARRAGYDLIELHAAHGYLLNTFLSPATNKRTDEFGGTPERRSKIVVDIIKEIHSSVGIDFPVGVRISAEEFIPSGMTKEYSAEIAKILESSGAAYINVGAGTYASHHKMNDVMRMEEGWKKPIWAAIKQAVNIPVIAGGGLRRPDFCENVLAEGTADFVGLARQMIADPYWAKKVKEGRIDDMCLCISCLRCLFALGGGSQLVRHCTINAMYGREFEYANFTQAEQKKNVMVIGGGVAGLEAARVAALRGHSVTLYEKEEKLGGQVLLSQIIPGKQKLLHFLEYLITQVMKQGVRVELGVKVTPSIIAKENPDAIIVATGALPLIPNIIGIQVNHVLTAWDILKGHVRLNNQEIIVVGGGTVGCETAEFLAKSGNKITILEMLPKMCPDGEPINRRSLLDTLNELGVRMLPENKVISIKGDCIIVENMRNGDKTIIKAEHIVWALGSKADKCFEELEGNFDNIYFVGDCKQPKTILEAINTAFLTSQQI